MADTPDTPGDSNVVELFPETQSTKPPSREEAANALGRLMLGREFKTSNFRFIEAMKIVSATRRGINDTIDEVQVEFIDPKDGSVKKIVDYIDHEILDLFIKTGVEIRNLKPAST